MKKFSMIKIALGIFMAAILLIVTAALRKIMDETLVKFNQSSILLEESKGKSTFYSGK